MLAVISFAQMSVTAWQIRCPQLKGHAIVSSMTLRGTDHHIQKCVVHCHRKGRVHCTHLSSKLEGKSDVSHCCSHSFSSLMLAAISFVQTSQQHCHLPLCEACQHAKRNASNHLLIPPSPRPPHPQHPHAWAADFSGFVPIIHPRVPVLHLWQGKSQF